MRHKYKTAEKRNILNISLYCVCIRLIYTPCYGVYTNLNGVYTDVVGNSTRPKKN